LTNFPKTLDNVKEILYTIYVAERGTLTIK